MSNMTVNGLSATVHLPKAPEGEGVHRLPPAHPIHTYVVDEYPECPTNWMHGSGKASSYFFQVEPGKHLWLDFNNNRSNPHDVAIVLSVQGVNPIIGPKEGYTAKLELERYDEVCPVHNVPFQQDRFCPTCNHKWPAQNYMTTTSWPHGVFWIDGWRKSEDEIRGFLITEDTLRGVAAQTIGEQRVFAIGIGFFLSKEAKPQPAPVMRSRGGGHLLGGGTLEAFPMSDVYGATKGGGTLGGGTRSFGATRSYSPPVETKKAEVGAGAKITQKLCYPDPKPLDYYEETPAGVIYANYCLPDQFDQIISGGKRKEKEEGWMEDLKVGN